MIYKVDLDLFNSDPEIMPDKARTGEITIRLTVFACGKCGHKWQVRDTTIRQDLICRFCHTHPEKCSCQRCQIEREILNGEKGK